MKKFFKDFFKQEWVQGLIPVAGWLYISLMGRTLKYSIQGEDTLQRVKKEGQPAILATWHGGLIPPMFYLRHQGIHVLSSTHRDSEYLAWILQKFGWRLVKGSSGKGGTRALIEMIRKLKEGHDIAMTPDGPTGPAQKLKPGTIYLAQKSGIPIIPVGVAAYPKKNLRSWDSFLLPGFFAKAVLIFGEPFPVEKKLTEAEIEERTMQLEQILNQLQAQAEQTATARR